VEAANRRRPETQRLQRHDLNAPTESPAKRGLGVRTRRERSVQRAGAAASWRGVMRRPAHCAGGRRRGSASPCVALVGCCATEKRRLSESPPHGVAAGGLRVGVSPALFNGATLGERDATSRAADSYAGGRSAVLAGGGFEVVPPTWVWKAIAKIGHCSGAARHVWWCGSGAGPRGSSRRPAYLPGRSNCWATLVHPVYSIHDPKRILCEPGVTIAFSPIAFLTEQLKVPRRVAPPLEIGIMWSNSIFSFLPHSVHLPLSRCTLLFALL